MTQLSSREAAVAGGLHKESIGPSYPWREVYIATGDTGWYEVHNLMTGEKSLDRFGTPKRFHKAQDAIDRCEWEAQT